MSSHRSIGLGVVGSGRMGTHRARLAAAHPGVDYLRVMDISAEAAERLAATTEADAFGDDLAALLDDPRVDAVIVSLPEDTHVDAVVAACASGRPVMVEKPLALEIAGGSKMVAEAAAAGVDLRVAYSARFLQ
ncbi:MAG TPA: Gfo/Idh/MocA family oxidoreductase, partial [Acidimicrobiia bacterium]|nr:Gfo/Idh/MocA family oxidoreductase [Acidimicrobiia bacterium]